MRIMEPEFVCVCVWMDEFIRGLVHALSSVFEPKGTGWLMKVKMHPSVFLPLFNSFYPLIHWQHFSQILPLQICFDSRQNGIHTDSVHQC